MRIVKSLLMAAAGLVVLIGIGFVGTQLQGQYIPPGGSGSVGPAGPTGPTGGNGALVQIQQQILASPAGTVTFSAIAGTYTNLELRYSAKSSNASNVVPILMRFNADSANDYIYLLNENESGTLTAFAVLTPGSSTQIGQIPAATGSAGLFGGGKCAVLNYATTTAAKMSLCETEGSAGAVDFYYDLTASWWTKAAFPAITSLTLLPSSGNFVTGSIFTLYGMQ